MKCRQSSDRLNHEEDVNYFLFQDTDEHINDDYTAGYNERWDKKSSKPPIDKNIYINDTKLETSESSWIVSFFKITVFEDPWWFFMQNTE